jgi:hypothetical protein
MNSPDIGRKQFGSAGTSVTHGQPVGSLHHARPDRVGKSECVLVGLVR